MLSISYGLLAIAGCYSLVHRRLDVGHCTLAVGTSGFCLLWWDRFNVVVQICCYKTAIPSSQYLFRVLLRCFLPSCRVVSCTFYMPLKTIPSPQPILSFHIVAQSLHKTWVRHTADMEAGGTKALFLLCLVTIVIVVVVFFSVYTTSCLLLSRQNYNELGKTGAWLVMEKDILIYWQTKTIEYFLLKFSLHIVLIFRFVLSLSAHCFPLDIQAILYETFYCKCWRSLSSYKSKAYH